MRFDPWAEALSRRGYAVHCFDTGAQAAQFVVDQVSAGQSVGIGGSMTVKQLALHEALTGKGVLVSWHWLEADAEGRKAAFDRAAHSDVYLASCNALSEDGIIVNVDGNGNRVGALAFGPKAVYLLVGRNKLVEGGEETALERVKNVACGLNARRLSLKTPCAATGHCIGGDGCASPDRMCKITSVLTRKPGLTDFHVVLVDEDLGY